MNLDWLFAISIVAIGIAASPYGATQRERITMAGAGALLLAVAVLFDRRGAAPELDSSASDSAPSARHQPVRGHPTEGRR